MLASELDKGLRKPLSSDLGSGQNSAEVDDSYLFCRPLFVSEFVASNLSPHRVGDQVSPGFSPPRG